MGELGVYVGALALVGQQAAEHLFGGFVKGTYMKYLAILTTVAAAYAEWFLGWGPTAEWDPARVGALGVLAGMGADVLNGLVKRFAPSAKEATLSKALHNRLNPPADVPLPPQPPRRAR